MYLLGTLFWAVVSGFIAWHLACVFMDRTRWKGNTLFRGGLAVLLWPAAFMAPLADEIVGKYQFDRLCQDAKEVRIYGTIPVGEELYTKDGKWRGFDTGDDPFRLAKIKRLYLRWEMVNPTDLHMTIPIRLYEEHIFDARTGKLLAEWRQYGTPGGWLSQSLGSPFLVRSQCMPKLVQESSIEKQILQFKSLGAAQ